MLSVEDQWLVDQIKERVLNPKRGTYLAEQRHSQNKPFPFATMEQIETTEAQIGFRLPELIREIYLHVGNGGFGPGYGIGGVDGGAQIYDSNLAQNVILCRSTADFLAEEEDETEDEYRPNWYWGDQYIMYCYWGCNVTTLVDCSDTSLPIYSLDSFDVALHTSKTLRQWWLDWLEDQIKQY
jgi:hypothetical protein